MNAARRKPALWNVSITLLGLALSASTATAYNPPVDTAGPLTVRIEGPAEVTQTDVPQPVRVLLENKADAPLTGTVELGLVDRWRAEPAGPVPFSVAAKSSATVPFTVTAGPGTYGGVYYPIHAYARFTVGSEPQVAHPILILQTKFPAAPRPPAAVEAVAEDGSVLGRQAVRVEGELIVLACEPKVFCYRFVGPTDTVGRAALDAERHAIENPESQGNRHLGN